jgi:serine/threonine protein phosphatase PrpC
MRQILRQFSGSFYVNKLGSTSLMVWWLLFYQADLFTWILIAIIGAIILMFILLAFILLPLTRREKGVQVQPRPETTTSEKPAAWAEGESTRISAPVGLKDETEIDTDPSLPTVKTVGEPMTLPVSGSRPANIAWEIAGLTDVGLKRELNEDNLVMIEGETQGLGPYGIYVVADGLGGHEAGEVASQLTVEAIQTQHGHHPPTVEAAPFEEWMKDAIMVANELVLKHQENSTRTEKMGSTLIMALVADHHAHIVNVGDSRAYHLNAERIEQISVDHSLVERLIQIGQITREEARTHEKKNVVYSIIGEKRKLEIGYYHVPLAPGDRLLLCSDGLNTMIPDEELLAVSKSYPEPAKASQMMIEAAKQAGGLDNITAILIQMNK